MGFMTLADFRDSVRHTLGGTGVGRAKVDRAINKGYFEVFSRVYSYKGALRSTSIDTADGVNVYILPDRARGIKMIADATNKRRLVQETINNIFKRHDVDGEAAPLYWAQDGVQLHVRPTPDAIYPLTIWYWQEPLPLSGAGDLSIFESDLDAAIDCFAKFYILQDMNHKTRARNWFTKGESILQSRITDFERELEGPDMLGAQVITELSELTDYV